MRRETRAEREAWTKFFDGETSSPKANKYGALRTGKYASKHEAEVAVNLKALESSGAIRELREQHPITLVKGDGKLRPIVYIADFTYIDHMNKFHVLDAKSGFTAKLPVYRLKKRLAALLLGIEIEEV